MSDDRQLSHDQLIEIAKLLFKLAERYDQYIDLKCKIVAIAGSAALNFPDRVGPALLELICELAEPPDELFVVQQMLRSWEAD